MVSQSDVVEYSVSGWTSYWQWLPSETCPSMDIFNGIRMRNRGGSPRLDRVLLLFCLFCIKRCRLVVALLYTHPPGSIPTSCLSYTRSVSFFSPIFFFIYFLLKCNGIWQNRRNHSVPMVYWITYTLSFAGDPPVQINKQPETVGNVSIFIITVIPFPICHLLDFYAVAVITLKNRNHFIISLFNQVHLLI